MPIRMHQADDWGTGVVPSPGAIYDTRALSSIIDSHGVPAEVGQGGEPFDQEVSESASIWSCRIYPAGVAREDRGFDAATDR